MRHGSTVGVVWISLSPIRFVEARPTGPGPGTKRLSPRWRPLAGAHANPSNPHSGPSDPRLRSRQHRLRATSSRDGHIIDALQTVARPYSLAKWSGKSLLQRAQRAPCGGTGGCAWLGASGRAFVHTHARCADELNSRYTSMRIAMICSLFLARIEYNYVCVVCRGHVKSVEGV